MLVLFFIHFLSARALLTPTVNNEATPPSCDDINNCRTVWDIIWSCLSTIFLCTWVAIHPNMSKPTDTPYFSPPKSKDKENVGLWNRFIDKMPRKLRKYMEEPARVTNKVVDSLKTKMPLFFIALLLPEYILAWAIRQYLMAGKVRDELKSVAQGRNNIEITRTHGFFIIMGGFHYFKYFDEGEIHGIPAEDPAGDQFTTKPIDHNSHKVTSGNHESQTIKEDNKRPIMIRDKSIHPLAWRNVVTLVKNDQIKLLSEGEIQDKSKSDWLGKTLVLLQTLWFVTQCVARWIEHLPTTELEIVTLAYTAVNLGIFIAWLDKPRNIEYPVQVFEEPTEGDPPEKVNWFKFLCFITGEQDNWIDLYKKKQVPMFYSGKPDQIKVYIADIVTLAVAVVFGGIHCIAWSFQFPSHTELLLWRISSIAIVALPTLPSFAGLFQLGSIFWEDTLGVSNTIEWSDLLIVPLMIIAMIILFLMPFGLLLYVAARLTTLVLAFMNLSSLSPGALETVNWTTFIPHL